MNSPKKKHYVRLGINMQSEERRSLENSIRNALQPTLPAELFVSELEQELMQEAHQHSRTPHRLRSDLRVFGLVGGGILSIAGGVLMWTLLRQNRSSEDAAPQSTRFFGLISPKVAKTPPVV